MWPSPARSAVKASVRSAVRSHSAVMRHHAHRSMRSENTRTDKRTPAIRIHEIPTVIVIQLPLQPADKRHRDQRSEDFIRRRSLSGRIIRRFVPPRSNSRRNSNKKPRRFVRCFRNSDNNLPFACSFDKNVFTRYLYPHFLFLKTKTEIFHLIFIFSID